MKRLLIGIVLFSGGLFFVLGFFQRKMIYYPTAALEMSPAAVGLAYEDVFFQASDGITLHGWFVSSDKATITLLFLHGNAGNISHRVDNVKRLCQLGFNIFIFDYRGYGQSDGEPHEKGLYLDAQAAFSFLVSKKKIPQEHIAVFGRSLGGAVATDLCSQVACGCLILESTFTSSADMARKIYPFLPLGPFLPERYDSLSKIENVKAPLLQFHGTEDEIIPYQLGQKLFRAAREPKIFVPIPGAGHNNTTFIGGRAYFEKIYRFLLDHME